MNATFLVFGLGTLWARSPLKVTVEGLSVLTQGRLLNILVMKKGEEEKEKLLPQMKFRIGSCPTRGLSSAVFSLLYIPTVPNLKFLPRLYSAIIPNMLFFSGMRRGAYS